MRYAHLSNTPNPKRAPNHSDLKSQTLNAAGYIHPKPQTLNAAGYNTLNPQRSRVQYPKSSTPQDTFTLNPKRRRIHSPETLNAAGYIHPPAAACSLIFISGTEKIKQIGWLYLGMPVIAGTCLLCALGMIMNNFAPDRKYPLFW